MEHKLAGRALGMDSRGDNTHRRNSPASTVAPSVPPSTPVSYGGARRPPWSPCQGILSRACASCRHASSILDPPSSLLRLRDADERVSGALAAAPSRPERRSRSSLRARSI